MANVRIVVLLLMGMWALSSCNKHKSDDSIKAYIESHPEEIISSVIKYRDKQKEEATQIAVANTPSILERTFRTGAAIPIANAINYKPGTVPRGKFVVEFIDYNCGFCKKSGVEIEKLASKYKNVEFFVVPASFLSADSESAIAAVYKLRSNNGNYAELHRELLDLPKVDSESAKAVYESYGIKQDALSGEISRISKNKEIFKSLQISATPTFYTPMGKVEGTNYNNLTGLLNKY